MGALCEADPDCQDQAVILITVLDSRSVDAVMPVCKEHAVAWMASMTDLDDDDNRYEVERIR